MNLLESVKNLTPTLGNGIITQIPDVVTKFEINTPLRLAHFLAQCGHESNGFKATVENLNYSADGLQKTFKKYFPTPEIANQYARNQAKIADRVYGGRMGNGPEGSGDGYKYRGRGYIQLTGKNNYDELSKATGINFIDEPDLVATKYPMLSAAWFFHKNGINQIADRGNDMAVITSVTKKINGGVIGLDDRASRFRDIYSYLT